MTINDWVSNNQHLAPLYSSQRISREQWAHAVAWSEIERLAHLLGIDQGALHRSIGAYSGTIREFKVHLLSIGQLP